MQLNDPRVIESGNRFDKSIAALISAGTLRYSAERHPSKPGYTLRDRAHRESIGDDVPGVGWVYWSAPKVLDPFVGWYKFKRDATARATALNECEDKR